MAGGVDGGAEKKPGSGCCPRYHEAVELIGRRWTGAVLAVLLDCGSLRFSELTCMVPDISDRLLSERVKELEARGLVERTVYPGPPLRVEYSLTEMGVALAPAIRELRAWARRWLKDDLERRAAATAGQVQRAAARRAGSGAAASSSVAGGGAARPAARGV
jgi:DNA-binding HxlR family transcriptional regulator